MITDNEALSLVWRTASTAQVRRMLAAILEHLREHRDHQPCAYELRSFALPERWTGRMYARCMTRGCRWKVVERRKKR